MTARFDDRKEVFILQNLASLIAVQNLAVVLLVIKSVNLQVCLT